MQQFKSTLIGAMALFSIGVPGKALAWGEEGHLTICELAYRNLTPLANSAVDDLLNSRTGGIHFPAKRSPTGSTSARYYTVFNKGCLEEDTRPRKHSSQHFINVARDTTHISGSTCPPRRPDDDALTNCILNGITSQIATLRDATKPQRDRVEALMGLGHWIGDIHQPLHVSFADDAGGNGIKVRLSHARCGTSGERPTKLHAVWDGCLLQTGLFEKVRQSDQYRAALARGTPWKPTSVIFAAATQLKQRTTVEEERLWVSTEPSAWAQESYSKTLEPTTLYCIQKAKKCQYSESLETLPDGAGGQAAMRNIAIDQPYLDANAKYAEERVRMAGHRLAHVINSALDPNYRGPSQN